MLWISIDRESSVPLTRQIYDQIRTFILRGDVGAGEKLPSTRLLAAELGVSRNLIVEVYEQLAAEGFLEGRQGSGHYVAPGAFLERANKFSQTGSSQAESQPERDADWVDFRSGIPALDLFPRKTWAKVMQRVCSEVHSSALSYGEPAGREELREVLSRYLFRSRGVECRPDQILITSGATQALTLIARVLVSEGDQVFLEDPVTRDIQTIFAAAGAALSPIPVDELGMQTELLPSDSHPRFVFVTPSHQFPLGGTLPIQRRIQLIQFARKSDCYIVEDDYDSEFRHVGPPVSSLQGLFPERVIYVGSFSKTLSPALRLGYLVLPDALVERYRTAKWFTDLHSPALEQLALSRFIEEGHFERHIARMKKVYRRRRNCLIDSLRASFADRVRITGSSTGMHLVAEFADVIFTQPVVDAALAAGVRIYPVEAHAITKNRHQHKLIMGYGHLDEATIAEGVKRLKSVIDQLH